MPTEDKKSATPFADMLDDFMRSLRIPIEYEESLKASLASSRQLREELRVFMNSPSRSFSDIPGKMKEVMRAQLKDFEKNAMIDFERRTQDYLELKTGRGGDVSQRPLLNRARDIALSEMTIEAFLSSIRVATEPFLPDLRYLFRLRLAGRGENPDILKNLPVLNENKSTKTFQSQPALPFLHLYVNSADPNNIRAGVEEKSWALSISQIKDLLELLDSQRIMPFVVIDGHEPIVHEKMLLALAGHLRLYNWEVILMTRGMFVTSLAEYKKRLENLSRVGLSWIHLWLCADVLKDVGMDAIEEFYRVAMDVGLKVTSSYYLDGHPESDMWMRRLLGGAGFNKENASFCVASEKTKGLQEKNGGCFWEELIVGNQGTLAAYKEDGHLLRICRLSDGDWEKPMGKWLSSQNSKVGGYV